MTQLKIAILSPGIFERDAVGNDCLLMQKALCELGHDCRLFTNSHSDSISCYKTSDIENFLNTKNSLLIYHFCISYHLFFDILNKISQHVTVFVRFHNVTPPSFFLNVNDEYVQSCQAALDELKKIVSQERHIYLPCSEFSKNDLLIHDVPANKIQILPPFHQTDDLLHTEPILPSTCKNFFTNHTSVKLLSVGRIAPNKGHLLMIETLHYLRNVFSLNVELVIAGKADPRLKKYSTYLKQSIKSHDLLKSIYFLDSVSPSELHYLYKNCDAYFITSHHEGFCVPLVEAMASHLPIVGYRSTAVTDTIGQNFTTTPSRYPLAVSRLLASLLFGSSEKLKEASDFGEKRFESEFALPILKMKINEIIQKYV